jgi:very-short-patch-repair endonuclease
VRDRKSLKSAKQLRRDLTPAEARLWYHLRAKRFAGVKFRRQTVIGPFIADFTCRTAMLVIEVDGDTHGSAIQYDAERTAFLEQQGWRVLRFTNADVLQNLEAVLSSIAQRLPLSLTSMRVTCLSSTPEGERGHATP